ncbi:MAG: indole-3-glycerol phosphate synthase TrpC [Spirochaetes bacterium]|nr:indole-3-glycerol phosphate synthase TrpC [Spirochaetota bacterium]
MILEKIIDNRKKVIQQEKKINSFDEIKSKAMDLLNTGYSPANFLQTYSKDSPFLIAEIKKASPSKGVIRGDFVIEDIAGAYRDAEAVNAVSVLTEPDYFQGKYEYIKIASATTGKPVLMKDFIVDEYQIYKGFIDGASAFLLICAVLTPAEIEYFSVIASGLGMKILFETHTVLEYKQALNYNFELIGINNRDLKTFTTDINTTVNIIIEEGKPENSIVITESGINTKDDIRKLSENGADGFLVGERFMREKDIAKAVSDLF